MNKKRIIKLFLWALNFLTIGLLIWSLVNYQFLNNEVTRIVKIGGLFAVILLVFILEGAPVFVGSSVAVATLLTMNTFNPLLVLALFLGFAILGNFAYFYLGYFSGEKILKYFDKEDVKKYKKLFKKNGKTAMIFMAISPLPYLPTLAGVFKMDKYFMFVYSMGVRLIRHTIVFGLWYFGLKII